MSLIINACIIYSLIYIEFFFYEYFKIYIDINLFFENHIDKFMGFISEIINLIV